TRRVPARTHRDGDRAPILAFACATLLAGCGPLVVGVAPRGDDGGDGGSAAAARFQPSGPLSLPTVTLSIAAADLRRHGVLDLVSANDPRAQGVQGAVSVLLGLGDGPFAPSAPRGARAPGAAAVAAGDFDGDGDMDLLVAAVMQTAGVLRNNGNTGFPP